jgi:hypothetical protein
MGLQELRSFMLLGLPVLHHVVNGLHPVEDEDKNQKNAVKKGC